MLASLEFFFGNISIEYILKIHIQCFFFFLVLPWFLFNANVNNWSEDKMQLGYNLFGLDSGVDIW